ncbi:hypothetical protein LX15_001313 [Streptoalloteichus tenebrarius]|uniref:MOSC domain-containing protein n=1 Tax=Streptoalloteichus tenebrarius (strain ATCC 17920 / DSM 40477 / JCM 4838 / CBS 697.72 / NBRC 16177 / NCIMB 11028 / NRRL B-12390 / A12253. 1 / ISP 5477) TaxID=1933 RepID=A0ABT1HQ37_STRSD|nr:MOSC N-terminal beta barrel domain-containing protein [Streptoalloteichus tenebrarius]MCP2257628.1 hypothetical protein [Streptoalloteichus tenebrarius]BFE98587.1 MOSC N-terminal beta barrel domain-containing protein [Streptoalloteichus tenebrarius]
MAKVLALTSYPVKGCAGIPVPDATVTWAGLAHDRSFMVVDPDGVFRSQRRDRRLALVRPEIDADGDHLTLHAPGIAPVRLAVATTPPRRPVRLFGEPLWGIDQGEAAAAWLTEVLGAPSRLVRVPPDHDRVVHGHTPGTSGYADSSPLHLVSLSSLDALNERITARGGHPVPMSRFRPNIVVDGWTTPHTEDRLRRVTIGETDLGYTKLAIRCAVTLVDQDTGAKSGPEPLRTLATYRRASQGGVAFGVKFAVLRPGKLSVGDEVTITAWGDSELLD